MPDLKSNSPIIRNIGTATNVKVNSELNIERIIVLTPGSPFIRKKKATKFIVRNTNAIGYFMAMRMNIAASKRKTV